MPESDFFSKTILVTGSGGQLGMEIWKLSDKYPSYNFLFTTKDQFAIDDFDQVKKFFEQQQIDVCINCAAYTAVDKAESEKEKAFSINADAAGNLANVCKAHQTQLIHISTDYVFNGNSTTGYKEADKISPINIYGESKLRGEELVLNNSPSAIIIRTSWVYSSFGNNFVKTMLRLFKERENINVVNDQYGCPTYAADLAGAIMMIVEQTDLDAKNGIYNYCNEGIITWYQFAQAIKEIVNSNCTINPIPTTSYPTPARRPQYSVLDTSKIKETFGISIANWKDGLIECLSLIS